MTVNALLEHNSGKVKQGHEGGMHDIGVARNVPRLLEFKIDIFIVGANEKWVNAKQNVVCAVYHMYGMKGVGEY